MKNNTIRTLIIVSVVIMILGLLSGFIAAKFLTAGTVVPAGSLDIDGSDFTFIFNIFAYILSFSCGLGLVGCSFGIVVAIWAIYGLVQLIKLIIKKLK